MDALSIILRLALVGVVVGALYAVVSAVDDSIRDHYVDPVKKEYEETLSSMRLQLDAEKQSNAALSKANVDAQRSVDTCNAKVDDIRRQSDASAKASAAAVEALRARAARDQSMIQALVDRAKGQPTEGDFCEQAQVAYRALVDLANRQRMRDKSSGPDGGGSGGPGAGESPLHR